MTEAADATEELGDEQRCSSSIFHAGVCTTARTTGRARAAPIAGQGRGRAQSSVRRARRPVRRSVLVGECHESFPQHPPALRDGHRSAHRMGSKASSRQSRSSVVPTDAVPGSQRQYCWALEAISGGSQTSKYSQGPGNVVNLWKSGLILQMAVARRLQDQTGTSRGPHTLRPERSARARSFDRTCFTALAG